MQAQAIFNAVIHWGSIVALSVLVVMVVRTILRDVL